MKKIILVSFFWAMFLSVSLEAAEIKGFKRDPLRGRTNENDLPNNQFRRFANNCRPASQSVDLDINNVRTSIMNGGDMWWDLQRLPKYEIPKVTDANAIRRHSMFAGALWIGGIGRGDGNLRLAAMTYRQSGSDFYPGPLDTALNATEDGQCLAYDKIWRVTRREILLAEESGWTDISPNILDWPGGANRPQRFSMGESQSMAPYFERPGFGAPGIYEPFNGEYPVLDPLRPAAQNKPGDQPDMMLWFVYNDRGNVHQESNGLPIGLELRTTAFAFTTNDEINNMTFYRSEIHNRGNEPLDNTFFGKWVDPDLGFAFDDYVGCDVPRNLGYCYNGSDFDPGVLGYGLNPPSVGTTFFEGPRDSAGNELGLYAFVYYNNNFDPINGNPRQAIHYYNYLRARWMNGNEMTFGGNGIGGTQITTYMYPGTTDPNFQGQTWSEVSVGNPAGDRRYLQSSGPFSLFPGAVNYVTVGVVWARTNSGGSTGSLGLLRRASDRAQRLFNNNFLLVQGPEAPDVEIQELENQLVFKFLNTDRAENYREIVVNETGDSIIYRFQGYMVYQLKDGTISTGELNDIDKARLVFQCDIKDNISQMINMEFDPNVGQEIPILKVDGKNEGIVNTFMLNEDVFARGTNKAMVNFKTYYYLIFAYGFPSNDTLKSEPLQFLSGRTVKSVRGVPHKSEPRENGTKLNSGYGGGPKLTRIEGRGNGGNVLELTKESIEEILRNNSMDNPTYQNGFGPVNIKVVDPFKVPVADFRLVMLEDTVISMSGSAATSPPSLPDTRYRDSIRRTSRWLLVNKTTRDTVFSDTTLAHRYESVQGVDRNKRRIVNRPSLADWGLSITTEQVELPRYNPAEDPTNGFISYEVIFEDLGKQWLTAVPDFNGAPQFNWIRSGTQRTTPTPNAYTDANVDSRGLLDPNGVYEKIWGGRIAPYALCSRAPLDASTGQASHGMAWFQNQPADNPMEELASIDFVITRDRSKWTECIVLEMGEDKILTEGNMSKFNLRWGTSRDRNFNPIAGERGTSFFPGYAINVETGERLNIAFGEDSYLTGERGSDMIWNPTPRFSRPNDPYPTFGGRHYVYIFGSYPGMPTRSFKGPIYDRGRFYKSLLEVSAPDQNPLPANKRSALSQAMWVIPTMVAPGFEFPDGMPPTDVTIKLRVRKPYTVNSNNVAPIYEFNTEDIAPEKGVSQKVNSMDLINIVPNPYKAFSAYETSPVDNRVKITNLPKTCTISIYTLAGTLVRRVKKDDELTFFDWDLRNNKNVPIATGLYIIHVDAGDLGEKVLKWYGVMRTIDLDSY
jgi:hypothetical protein